MGIRPAIMVGCKIAIALLAFGYLGLMLPSLALGLALGWNQPWDFYGIIDIIVELLSPLAILILGWWLAGKLVSRTQP
jgi:hypothetical protein